MIDEEIKEEIKKYKLANAAANNGASFGLYLDDDPPQEASSPHFAPSDEENESYENQQVLMHDVE